MELDTQPAIHDNSAARLHKLFLEVCRLAGDGQTRTLAVWQQALKISDGKSAEHTVATVLSAAHAELNAIEAALTAHRVPEHLYVPFLKKFHAAVGLSHLHNQVKSVTGQLNDTSMLALAWFAFVLPDQGQPSTEAFDRFVQEVATLEAALQAEGIPEAFRKHAEDVLDGLKAAISLFPVQGTEALRPAVRKAVSDAYFDEVALKEALTDAPNAPAVDHLRTSVATAVGSAARFTGDVDKLMSSYGKVLGWAGRAGQIMSDLAGTVIG